jgi:hypothetical protein
MQCMLGFGACMTARNKLFLNRSESGFNFNLLLIPSSQSPVPNPQSSADQARRSISTAAPSLAEKATLSK